MQSFSCRSGLRLCGFWRSDRARRRDEPNAAAGEAAGSSRGRRPQHAGHDRRGKIGDVAIYEGELEERLLREISAARGVRPGDRAAVTAESVLRQMLAEKAMSLEGRKLGYLKDEQSHSAVARSCEQRL